jgi:uncharacterized protein (TIGR03435 family)
MGLVIAVGAFATPALAQASAGGSGETFAVAAIRQSGPDAVREIKFLPGGHFVARNATVRLLIKIAYSLNDDEVSGGPGWIGMTHFDIDAKADALGASDSNDPTGILRNRQLLLQNLLRDRFQLKLRAEMKDMATFALVPAKSGPKLKPSVAQDGGSRFQGNVGTMVATNANMDQLANALSDWVGHPVKNMTGIGGKYDLRLEWTPDQPTQPQGDSAGAQASSAYSAGPTIFTALQQQLGLSLQSRKSSALCEVVESVQLPSGN